MAVYDNYTEVISSHPGFVQKMEACRQKKIIREIKNMLSPSRPFNVLETGIGTGLFARAVKEEGWQYTGIDRSKKICALLGRDYKVLQAELPPFPKELSSSTFDLVYAAFVLEHMKNGVEAHDFISALSDHTMPGGAIVLIVPDSLSLGMEFWNLDYTHTFPTTERNVRQVLEECGMEIILVKTYRGPYITG